MLAYPPFPFAAQHGSARCTVMSKSTEKQSDGERILPKQCQEAEIDQILQDPLKKAQLLQKLGLMNPWVTLLLTPSETSVGDALGPLVSPLVGCLWETDLVPNCGCACLFTPYLLPQLIPATALKKENT